MSLFTKNNIKNLLIILLLITNLTTITTIILHGHKMKTERHFRPPPPPPPPNGHFTNFLSKELNLSTEQEEDFKDYRKEFMQESKMVMDEMKIYRDKINDELKKENPSKVILDSAATEIGGFHEKLKILSFDMILKMKKTCNKEQKEKLIEVFIDMQPKHQCKSKHRKKR